MSSDGYTISQAAREAGVGVETIRFYERQGLIERPSKPVQGARRYPQATVDRIRALRQGQELGFSLAEVGDLLALRTDPGADCAEVRARAEAHLRAIERKRAHLGEVAAKLDALIAACPGEGATHACAILDAFTGERAGAGDSARGETAAARQVELRVADMVCGGCAGRVRALLLQAPGTREANVDRVAGIARVRVASHGTDAAELARRLTAAGFPSTPR